MSEYLSTGFLLEEIKVWMIFDGDKGAFKYHISRYGRGLMWKDHFWFLVTAYMDQNDQDGGRVQQMSLFEVRGNDAMHR